MRSPQRRQQFQGARVRKTPAATPNSPTDHTVATKQVFDPPHVPINTRQVRRVRILPTANTIFAPTPATIAASFPNAGTGWETFRILKFDFWSTDDQVGIAGTGSGTSSYGCSLTPTGIYSTGVGNSVTFGDAATTRDAGTTGNDRAQVHVIPAREYAQKWWLVNDTSSVPFSCQSVPLAPAASTSLNVLDLLVEMMSTS